MAKQVARETGLSSFELSEELAIEDEQLGLLRCARCGLAWTAELFQEEGEEAAERLSCPRCSEDRRNAPLVPMGGVERRPLVRGGTVRMTYFYNPDTMEHLGVEEKQHSKMTVRHERRRHALRKAILRALGA